MIPPQVFGTSVRIEISVVPEGHEQPPVYGFATRHPSPHPTASSIWYTPPKSPPAYEPAPQNVTVAPVCPPAQSSTVRTLATGLVPGGQLQPPVNELALLHDPHGASLVWKAPPNPAHDPPTHVPAVHAEPAQHACPRPPHATHTPPLHECPAPHEDEHAPAHVPGAHAQVPPAPEHAIPDEQSADVQQCPAPTHIEPQACIPLGHAQVPPGVGHVMPAAQSLVAQHDEAPMHIPEQLRIVDGQLHAPWPSHTWPPAH